MEQNQKKDLIPGPNSPLKPFDSSPEYVLCSERE